MPEPILTTAIVAGYALLQPLARGTTAFSESARRLSEDAVDPDGQVSLEWFGAKDRIFSISFGDRGRVAYAGIDGSDRWRGAEHFDGHSIPPFLQMGIRRVIA